MRVAGVELLLCLRVTRDDTRQRVVALSERQCPTICSSLEANVRMYRQRLDLMISDGEEKDVTEVGNGAGLYTADLQDSHGFDTALGVVSQPNGEAGSSMTVRSNVSGVQVTDSSVYRKHCEDGGGSQRPRVNKEKGRRSRQRKGSFAQLGSCRLCQ